MPLHRHCLPAGIVAPAIIALLCACAAARAEISILDDIRGHGTIKVGTAGDYAPCSFLDIGVAHRLAADPGDR